MEGVGRLALMEGAKVEVAGLAPVGEGAGQLTPALCTPKLSNRSREAPVFHLYTNSSVATVSERVATLTERVAHLPTKGFIIAALLGSLAVMTALVAFQGQIQAFLKITH